MIKAQELYLLISLFLLIVGMIYFFDKQKPMMVDEWRERLKKLDTEKPMKSRIEGKPGVSTSVKVNKENIVLVKTPRTKKIALVKSA
jgi:hypothetical protein